MTTFGDENRAHMRQTSASHMYALPVLPEQQAAQRPKTHYEQTAPKTLADYSSATPRSKWEPKSGDSDLGYVKRVDGIGLQVLAENLPADEFQRVATAYGEARQRLDGGEQSHSDLRQHLNSQNSGSGVGIMGSTTPQHRAAILGNRGFAGDQRVEKMGHLAASASQPLNLGGTGARHTVISLWDRLPKPVEYHVPQRTDISQMRSIGEGWHTR